MKKIIALILSFCLLLPCIGIAVAAEAGYTLSFAGEGAPEALTGAVTYLLPTPTAPEGKVFAGWQGQLGEAAVFLPAGAEVTLEADATLTAVYVGIAMRKNPQIRYDIEGLRFLTKIDKADLAALQQYATVGYGTLIAPKNHLSKTQSLTHTELVASGKTYLDVVTAGAYAEDEEIVWVAGSIGHVKTKNFCRTLLAAGYLSLTYTDGSTGYVYAPATGADSGHYLYDHAVTAYTDRTEAADYVHVYEAAGGYSPCTAEQLGFLKRVLDSTVNMKLTGPTSNPTITLLPEAACYTAPFTATYSRVQERIIIKVREGVDYRFDEHYQSLIWDGMIMEAGHDADSDYTISQDGKSLYIEHGEYSDFY